MGARDRESESQSTTTFGPFTLDPQRAALTRDGRPVALRPKTFALLSYFVAHPGRVLDKQELLAAVWPGVVVTDDSLSQCVRELRVALGDGADGLIRTVPRRGYLFEPTATDPTPEAPVPLPADTAPAAARTRPAMAWIGVAAAAAFVAGGVALTMSREGPPVGVDQAIKARRSIAVMPFAEHGSDPRGYFAESVTEDLVTELSRLPDTRVIARASAALAGGQGADVRTLGRDLGVRHVLLGTVRREGAAVQIHARFVSAADGVVLWSEQFDYRDAAAWDWRRDIALRVARVLDVQLSAAARQPVRSGRELGALDAVLEGQHLLRHLGRREDTLRARALFEAALAVEPGSVSALTGWAQSHLAEVEFFRPKDAQVRAAQVALADKALTKALAIDPQYPYAKCLRGHVLRERGDFEGALAVYRNYVASHPSEAWAHARIGAMKLLLGRPEEVAAHMAAALALSPLEHELIVYAQLRAAVADLQLGRDDDAYRRFHEVAGAGPVYPGPRLGMAAIDALHGREARAAAHLAHANRLRPGLTISGWLEQTRGLRGDHMQAGTERLAEGLRRAGLPQ